MFTVRSWPDVKMHFKSRSIGVPFVSCSLTKIVLQFMLFTIFSTPVRCMKVRYWIANTNVTIGSRYWDSMVTIGSFTFNGSMTHAVAIPRVKDGLDECELIYPLDKLPSSVSSHLYNTTEKGECVDEKVMKKIDRVFWLDPRNWRTEPWASWTSFDSNEAVPHVERIPCNYDGIVIPNKTNTFIVLPPNPVILNSLHIGETFALDNDDWRIFSKDEYVQRHFIDKSSRDLSDMFDINFLDVCGNLAGCKCHEFDYTEEVCAFIIDDCVKDLRCERPLTPMGHCCSICGAVLMLTFDKSTFIFNKLEPIVYKFINNQMEKMEYEVDYYMSKVSNHLIQIVILPKNEYSNVLLDIADGLKLYLERTNYLGVNCWVLEAGKATRGHQIWPMIANIFVGLAVAIIAVIFTIFKYRRRKIHE